MDRALKNLQMVIFTKVSILRASQTVMANTTGKMAVIIKDTLKMD